MATVHTPHNKNTQPKSRKSIEKVEMSKRSNSPQVPKILTQNRDTYQEKLKNISNEIVDSIATSKSLLNQTRNMRSELKIGLMENLQKITVLSANLITTAIVENERDEQKEKDDMEEKCIGCGNQQELKKVIEVSVGQGHIKLEEWMEEKVKYVEGKVIESNVAWMEKMNEIIKKSMDVRMNEMIKENKILAEEIKRQMKETQKTMINECKIMNTEINRKVEIINKMNKEIMEECRGMKGEMNESVKEISKSNKEVVEECKGMKGEIVRKVENVWKLNEEMIKESKENVNKAVDEWRVGPPAEQKHTYAGIVAGDKNRTLKSEQRGKTLHSLVVTDKEDFMSGDEIIKEIGKIMNAKEEGIKVDRIRKGKGRKVIIGFSDKNEREKIRNKIESSTNQFEVEEIKNKDPQVVLYGVYKTMTDEELINAIKTQNSHLIQQNPGEERMKVKYKRKGKDDQTEHVVLTVSPGLWQAFTEAGHLYIDIQRVRVADQSPLIQCSHCLGYGHGKRHCNKTSDEVKCGHCAGTHHQSTCEKMIAREMPTCINCKADGLEKSSHNAFSAECPVRQRWEAIARATVAYKPENM